MLTVLRKLFGVAAPAVRADAHDPSFVDVFGESAVAAIPEEPAPPAEPSEPFGDSFFADADATGAVRIQVYATRSELPLTDFPHALHGRRGLDDPELRTHLERLAADLEAPGASTPSHRRLLRHLQHTRQHLNLTLHAGGQARFAAWCRAADAIMALPDGSLRDASGRRLTEDDAAEPAVEPSGLEEARRRRERSAAALAQRGLDAPAELPPSECEPRPRAPAEAFGRAAALAVAAVRAESARDGDLLPPEVLRERLPVAFDHLSAAERAFLANDAPTAAEIARFDWGYEAQATLQWALGLDAELPFPERLCDAARVTATMLAAGDDPPARFALRPTGELLDELDLCACLQAIASRAHADAQPAPAGFHEAVVRERHRTLGWLLRRDGIAGDRDWDRAETPA
jgi:hypothetical protein